MNRTWRIKVLRTTEDYVECEGRTFTEACAVAKLMPGVISILQSCDHSNNRKMKFDGEPTPFLVCNDCGAIIKE